MMPTDQDQDSNQVPTGLTAPVQQKPTLPSPVEAAAPVASADVPFAQVASLPDDVTRKVDEVNQARESALAAQAFRLEDQRAAENENTKREFLAKVEATRKSHEPREYVPPAVPERIAENTRLEMEAGRKRVAEFEAIEAARPRRAPVKDPREGSTTSVFRPNEFDEYKASFRGPGNTTSKDNLRQPGSG